MLLLAVCDDEKYYREQIKLYLGTFLDKRQIAYGIDTFSSGEEFCKQHANFEKYQIIFLDINMDGLSGIELAYRLRTYKKDVYIVFVTSYINYAIEGYKVDAIRYIMKENLHVSIIECMNAIMKKMELQINKTVFTFLDGKRQIFVDKILYLESHKHKIFFKIYETVLKEYEMYEKLDNIEKMIKGYGFLRIHKSYLVNMKYINRINNYKAILVSNDELPIPKLKYQKVKEAYILWKGEL